MVKQSSPGRITQVGVENLHILAPAQAIGIDQPQHQALRMSAVVDAWARNIDIDDTVNSVATGGDVKRVTVENVSIRHSVATVGAANWAIGCQGTRETSSRPFEKGPKLPEGIFDTHGTPVRPSSLYLAQLQERLGPSAPRNIGY